MNERDEVPWWKVRLIAVCLGPFLFVGGFGVLLIPLDNGCPPTPVVQMRNSHSCFVPGSQNIEEVKKQIDQLIQLVTDVERLGGLICAEKVHVVEVEQAQQDTELKKATNTLNKAREELIKKAQDDNLVFDRVDNSFLNLGLPIIHDWKVSNREVSVNGQSFPLKNPEIARPLLNNIEKVQSSPWSFHYFPIIDKIKKLVKGGKEYWQLVMLYCR